ncbi:g2254 [Coccomyxa viridis]|uniref:G2254 protein n=1 Tax=Coccomyxa viridis TaxID=1274662 RepID=A0ABP1FRX0_9CHLO
MFFRMSAPSLHKTDTNSHNMGCLKDLIVCVCCCCAVEECALCIENCNAGFQAPTFCQLSGVVDTHHSM